MSMECYASEYNQEHGAVDVVQKNGINSLSALKIGEL